jgi:type VI protein secretion system component VasK
MSGEILAAGLVAAQEHNPPAAHVVMLAALVAIALVVFGLVRWRRRRARPEQPSSSHDRSAESTRSREPK